jgi:hypothetical protein
MDVSEPVKEKARAASSQSANPCAPAATSQSSNRCTSCGAARNDCDGLLLRAAIVWLAVDVTHWMG